MWAGLRQLRYPPEFRIPAAGWSSDHLARLEKALRELPAQREDPELGRHLGQVATSLWRVRQKLARVAQGTVGRDLTRAVESAWDALAQAGVMVREHTGDVVTGGEAFRILTFEPAPGLAREQVVETLRPTIFYHDKVVQPGEVVVGKPVAPPDG